MNLAPLAPFLAVSEIILAISLTILVLLQAKGSDLGSFMGSSGDSGGFRTRRGIEQTIYRLTIYCAILFFINTILAFLAWG
jgi:preprotein translocase subunit SecG